MLPVFRITDLLDSWAGDGLKISVLDTAVSLLETGGFADDGLEGLVSFNGVFFLVRDPPNRSVSRSSIPYQTSKE